MSFRKGLSNPDFFHKGAYNAEHRLLSRNNERKLTPQELLGSIAHIAKQEHKHNPLLKRV